MARVPAAASTVLTALLVTGCGTLPEPQEPTQDRFLSARMRTPYHGGERLRMFAELGPASSPSSSFEAHPPRHPAAGVGSDYEHSPVDTVVAARASESVEQRRMRRRPRRPAPRDRPVVPSRPSVPSEAHDRVILDRVYFRRNHAGLESGRDALDAIAELAVADPITLMVIAHAHHTEDDPQQLSVRRAETVRNYLLERGVSRNRVLVRAMGARQPLEAPSSGDGAENRCVQIAVAKRSR